MRLSGKVAVVTGAARGFGAGIAARFADEGAMVVLADLDLEAAATTAGRIGGIALACDVADARSVQAATDATMERHGRIDILVNNAGTTHRNQPLLAVDEATFDRIYAVNVKSLYHTARAIVPIMREQGGGSIINIGSTAGLRPRPGLVWYNGTKGAVNTITLSMALELAPDRVRVNAICPVLGSTGLTESFIGGPATGETLARFVATIPLGRMSRPEDIANACVFLAEDASEFITGVLLPVDGGRTA
jgi:3-oxoacyl-[acyl-carrier protein] reductase